MNKKVMLSAAALLVTAALGAACGKNESANGPAPAEKGMQSSGNSNAKPSLTADYTQDGHNVTITYKVENMKISADHYGHQAVPGEGHLHVYVDGVQKAGLKSEAPVRLENLSPGKHTIKLDLQNNDHTPIGIEKTFQIEIK